MDSRDTLPFPEENRSLIQFAGGRISVFREELAMLVQRYEKARRQFGLMTEEFKTAKENLLARLSAQEEEFEFAIEAGMNKLKISPEEYVFSYQTMSFIRKETSANINSGEKDKE